MKTWVKVLIVTLVLDTLTFLANSNGPLGGFWAPAADSPKPVGIQLPFFILIGVAESVAFGLGVSSLAFGYPLVKAVAPASKAMTIAAFLSITWLLISWWPHDSLHIHNGMNVNGLLAIEYGFHVTLMMAGLILAYFFLTILRQGTPLPGGSRAEAVS